MKFLDTLKKFFTGEEEKKDLTRAEEVRDLIKKTVAEEDRHLFQHFCHEDLRKLLELKEGHELRDQSVEDILDHMDRSLTKTSITNNEREFCADVILKMFLATNDRGKLFERIETHIGNEHFIQDLVKHNNELAKVVNALR